MVLLIVLLLSVGLRQWRSDSFHSPPPSAIAAGLYHVARVVDGDTLLLSDPHARIRLIGADAPETVKPNWPIEPWGPEASQFTKRFVAGGEVRLEFDGSPRDKYGRILAYVWVGRRMLNEELIRAGLARAEMQYSYSERIKARFRLAESEARHAHRGIWSRARGGPP
ncbi:MAG: thermonuclease family protein [Thermoguttaceae bacterium]